MTDLQYWQAVNHILQCVERIESQLDQRYFEAEIISRMARDNWKDIPENGELWTTVLGKILSYIDWLRGEAKNHG